MPVCRAALWGRPRACLARAPPRGSPSGFAPTAMLDNRECACAEGAPGIGPARRADAWGSRLRPPPPWHPDPLVSVPPPCLPRGWHLLAASVRARRASARGCGLCPWGQRPRASHARRPARLAGPLTTVFGTAPCASRHCARLLPRRPRPPPTARRGRVRLAKRPRPPAAGAPASPNASVRPAQTPGHRISLNP